MSLYQFKEGDRVISIKAYGYVKGTFVRPSETVQGFIVINWDRDHNQHFDLASHFFAASVLPLAYFNSPLYQALL